MKLVDDSNARCFLWQSSIISFEFPVIHEEDVCSFKSNAKYPSPIYVYHPLKYVCFTLANLLWLFSLVGVRVGFSFQT